MNELTPSAAHSAKLDNVKGVLIVLIVLGHFCLNYSFFAVPTLSEYITKCIYFFYMPAMVFIAGYYSFTEGPISAKPYLKLLLCYLIMNTLMMLYEHIVNNTALLVMWPYYACWIFTAVIFWNLIIRVLRRYNMGLIFVLSLIISVAAGFQLDINQAFTLMSVTVLFPFFIAGYMMKEKNILYIFDKIPVKIFAVFLAAATLASMLYLIFNYDFNLDFLQFAAYTGNMFAVKRIIGFCLAIAAIFVLFALLPNRRIPLIAKWGKNFLSIYIFHRFFIIAFTTFFLETVYVDKFLIPIMAVTLIICILLGSNTIGGLFIRAVDKVIDNVTGDMSNPSVKKTVKVVMIVLTVLSLYVCVDPLLIGLHV